MKALLIAEKGSLRRTIEKVYEKHKAEIPYEITFTEQRGHLLTLKSPDEMDDELKTWSWDTLPIHPEEHGGWKYKVIQEKKVGNFPTAAERYKHIKSEIESGQYDFIINAGDPDQEGELLVRIVLAHIGTKNIPIKRYWSNDTTETKVLEALKNLKDDQNDPMLKNLLAAAYARQHSDYRFGMNLSRAATLKMKALVACGRVMTVILAVVCKREHEIKNFVPKTCYGIKSIYTENFDGQYVDLKEIEESGEDKKSEEEDVSKGIVWFDDKREAEDLMHSLSHDAVVTAYDSNTVESYAPKLYKLATAQVAAGKMGFTAKETLDIIQSLYEKGYVSYPRTDCEYISPLEDLNALLISSSAVPRLVPFVQSIEQRAIEKVKATKKWCNEKELQKSGHSALTPTSKKPAWGELSEQEKKIYELICERFVAIFLPPLVQDKVSLIADIDGKTFRSTGKRTVSKGYTELFGTEFTDTIIPPHNVGDHLIVDDFQIMEKTTTCPKRFTDATLIAVCEAPHKYLEDQSLKALGKRLSIGTPATRASIIEELITKNKYLRRMTEKRTTYIVPTDIGMSIYENLKNCDICKIDLTGEWEILLEQIRNGELSFMEMENRMKADVERVILDIKNTEMQPIGSDKNAPLAICPECGGEIYSGQKSYFCSNWKDKGCKVGAYKRICDSTLAPNEFISLISGQNIKKKLTKGTSSWTQELTYNFDEHKIEFVKREDGASQDSSRPIESDYYCPRCSEKMVESPKLFSCPGCEFKFWKSTCGKMLSPEQIKNFFETGDTGLIGGLKANSGNFFNAHIVLKADRSGTEFFYED